MKKALPFAVLLILAGCANLPLPGQAPASSSAPRLANATIQGIQAPPKKAVMQRTQQTSVLGNLLDSAATSATNAIFAEDARVTVRNDKGQTSIVSVPPSHLANFKVGQRVFLDGAGGKPVLMLADADPKVSSSDLAEQGSQEKHKKSVKKIQKTSSEKQVKDFKVSECKIISNGGDNYKVCYGSAPIKNAVSVTNCIEKPNECAVKSGYKSIVRI